MTTFQNSLSYLRGKHVRFAHTVHSPAYSADLERLRMALGVPDLYLAQESDSAHLFPNAEVGAMHPLGPLFDIPVYLDREVANREFIAFNAGTHRDLIHMRMADFWELVRPVAGEFSLASEMVSITYAM